MLVEPSNQMQVFLDSTAAIKKFFILQCETSQVDTKNVCDKSINQNLALYMRHLLEFKYQEAKVHNRILKTNTYTIYIGKNLIAEYN